MPVAVITGANTIRYPVKQPYRLSGIYRPIFLYFTIKLLNLKFPYFPFPIANYQARSWYVYTSDGVKATAPKAKTKAKAYRP